MTRPNAILATVLYEDSPDATKVKGFGPHVLLTQCISDIFARDHGSSDVHAIRRRVSGLPCKGVDKLLSSLQSDMDRLASGGSFVFALIDRDDIHDHLKPRLSPAACKTMIVEQIKAPLSSRDLLKIVLLERNIETLLQKLQESAPSLASPESWTKAIAQKKLNERDAILNKVANDPSHQHLRDQLRQQVPSFEYLVQHVAKTIAPHFGLT